MGQERARRWQLLQFPVTEGVRKRIAFLAWNDPFLFDSASETKTYNLFHIVTDAPLKATVIPLRCISEGGTFEHLRYSCDTQRASQPCTRTRHYARAGTTSPNVAVGRAQFLGRFPHLRTGRHRGACLGCQRSSGSPAERGERAGRPSAVWNQHRVGRCSGRCVDVWGDDGSLTFQAR